MTLREKPLENIVGKEENAGNQHFSSFPTMFSNLSETEIIIRVTFILLLAQAVNLVSPKYSHVVRISLISSKELLRKVYGDFSFSAFVNHLTKLTRICLHKK